MKAETTNPDKEMFETLVGEGGPLSAGTMPNLELATEEGVKRMCESVAAGAAVQKKKATKAKAPKTGGEAEAVEPASEREILVCIYVAFMTFMCRCLICRICCFFFDDLAFEIAEESTRLDG